MRVGFDIDGVRHWRAYSLTSDPDRPDGFISITPKLVEEGKVTPFIHGKLQPGALVFLATSRASSCCPIRCRSSLLFISAGSGITPIMSMLRSLHPRNALGDVVHLTPRALRTR